MAAQVEVRVQLLAVSDEDDGEQLVEIVLREDGEDFISLARAERVFERAQVAFQEIVREEVAGGEA